MEPTNQDPRKRYVRLLNNPAIRGSNYLTKARSLYQEKVPPTDEEAYRDAARANASKLAAMLSRRI